jgi:hypothetical protein
MREVGAVRQAARKRKRISLALWRHLVVRMLSTGTPGLAASGFTEKKRRRVIRGVRKRFLQRRSMRRSGRAKGRRTPLQTTTPKLLGRFPVCVCACVYRKWLSWLRPKPQPPQEQEGKTMSSMTGPIAGSRPRVVPHTHTSPTTSTHTQGA